MIKAFLFDMDGVLVDSEGLSITVGMMYFKTIGKNAEIKDFDTHLGCGEREFFEGTAKDLGIKDFDYPEASSFFKKEYSKLLENAKISLPGAVELISNAHRVGIKTAIASSAPKWKVYANMKAIGLSESSVDLVLSGEDVVRSKPFGDIYRLAMIKLGLIGKECVVFEDTVGGIKSGKDAGCRVVSLATTIDSESAFSAGADGVVSDLSAIGEFSTIEEIDKKIDEICGISDSGVVYGANYIAVGKKRISDDLIEKSAIDEAWRAWENAYAPYSGFKVGAAVVSASTSRIYSGCNVENSSYGGTICAERSAILSAIAKEGKIGIDLIVIVSDDDPPAPPCAICRQFISEFARPETRIILLSKSGSRQEYRFDQLLPHPFIMPAMRK